jgi:ribulose-bisphosphate carboxylase small chain
MSRKNSPGVAMRLTQGCFSYLPELTQEQLRLQVNWALSNSWALSVEYTEDPHPRNNYWNMWGLPLFDIKDPEAVLLEVARCCKANPQHYVKLSAFDNTRGIESCVMAFIVARPDWEPGFRLVRQEGAGRKLQYTIESYAVHRKPPRERYL